uniref:Shroom family member 4 n=1 Tax=Tetraodon nigroviridis TaxID=99883 RepID=H3CJS4_TETNG
EGERMETVEQLVSFHHIQVQLSGGAPWGFTLKGGLEHGEPLIITKIEDGGKAAVCAKLKVGDELININGSTLYGSRQEALILIKGSFRILKLTVRRRRFPAIRPHSWHLPKPSSAMQLHPGPYSLPWHTSDNSSDFLQWGQLSRPYSSTDRSSSLGSMESLDTPTPTTQPYSDSCNSPTDPAAFANKRDSAYSSFSASSNTSDYAAVPLRPDEACSMDNLLQSLGPSCQGFPGPSALGSPSTLQAQLLAQKSRSLTRPRPRNGESGAERKRNAPQPPTRKDSFRATQSRPSAAADKRCGESSGVSSYEDGNKPPGNAECGIPNGFPAPGDSDRTPKAPDSLQTHTDHTPDNSPDTGAVPVHLPDPETASPAHLASGPPGILPPQPPLGLQGQQLDLRRSKSKQTSVALHRHSAPEKLLATQLQLLQLASEPCSQADMSQGRDQGPPPRDASRSSTPGSVFLGGEEDASSQQTAAPSVNGGCRHPPLEQQHAWGRSVSVPGDAGDTAAQGGPGSEAIAEGGFEPLSTAASMDTLLEQKGGQGKREPGEGGAKRSSRSHLRNRRRTRRFATNLRNEIQRKKAQLQRSRGPGGCLCTGETVQEEEGAEGPILTRNPSPLSSGTLESHWPRRPPLGRPPASPSRQQRTLETQAGPGRSRFWTRVCRASASESEWWRNRLQLAKPAGGRWTPEHKLQPEPGPEPPYGLPPEAVLGVPGSQHGVCAFTAPFYGRSASCHRVEESSILPFADRMKFFEESSRGESAHPRQTKGQIQAQIQAGEPERQNVDQSQGRAAGSAFHPVTVALRPPEGPHSPPQGYTGRSHLPAETNAYPQRERSGLNRKRKCLGHTHAQGQENGRATESWMDREMFASALGPLVASANPLTVLSLKPHKEWEQFHRRRASHHALFWSSVPAPPSVPHSSSYLPPPEASRQRSYSLPPERQEVSQGCPRCTCSCAQALGHTLTLPSNQSPPQMQEPPLARAPSGQRQPQLQEAFGLFSASPTFSRRAFKPVAPPTAEREPIGPARARTRTVSREDSAPWEQGPSGTGLHLPELPATGRPQKTDLLPPPRRCRTGGSRRCRSRGRSQRPQPQSGAQPGRRPGHPRGNGHRRLPGRQRAPGGGAGPQQRAAPASPCRSPSWRRTSTPLAEGESSPALAGSGWLEEEPEGRDSVSLSLDELFPHSQHGESGTDSLDRYGGKAAAASPAFPHLLRASLSPDRRSGASSSCSYYSTSTAKAQLLTQLKDCAQDREDDDELTYKKQLMESLRKKLGVLREAQRGLQDDVRANAQLGEEVESKVVAACKPNEVDKFRMFIGDLDKVVSLMLSLSGRLLRVETTLDTLDPDTELQERLPLLEKKRQLTRQLSEAQDLKEHVDRREQAVSRVLARCLSPEQHRDYSHFVKMKAALLVEQRQLEDKIRLGEEQLTVYRRPLFLGFSNF